MLACRPNMIEICQDHVRKSVEFVSLLLEFATGCRFFWGIKVNSKRKNFSRPSRDESHKEVWQTHFNFDQYFAGVLKPPTR